MEHLLGTRCCVKYNMESKIMMTKHCLPEDLTVWVEKSKNYIAWCDKLYDTNTYDVFRNKDSQSKTSTDR